MEKIEQLLEDYRIALLEWNDACRNSRKDKGIPKRTFLTYNNQRESLNKLQDFIIKQSGDIRHFKRNGEI